MSSVAKTSPIKIILMIVVLGIAGVVAIFALIQLIPYGRNHTNPPVLAEPNWDSPQTRQLAERACFDCHSNETVWPWYANVAPASWLIQKDVDEGREKLNFSEWNQPQEELDEIGEVIQEGEMPPFQFLILHPEGKLSAEEKQTLINGLNATLSSR